MPTITSFQSHWCIARPLMHTTLGWLSQFPEKQEINHPSQVWIWKKLKHPLFSIVNKQSMLTTKVITFKVLFVLGLKAAGDSQWIGLKCNKPVQISINRINIMGQAHYTSIEKLPKKQKKMVQWFSP